MEATDGFATCWAASWPPKATSIALFSCYERIEAGSPARRLLVEAKEPGGPAFAIPLAHDTVVVFSADTNRRFRHRIVLDRRWPPR